MSIAHQHAGDVVTVRAVGELDLTTGPELETYILAILDNGGAPGRVALDLSDVGFLDSSGVSALIGAWRLTSGHGSVLVVSAMSPFVQRVLDVTGLTEVLAPK